MTSSILRRKVRKARSFPGLYRATVLDTDDPQLQHRVQLTVPAVSVAPSSWAPTVRDVAGRPQVGDEVLVGFEAGDPDRPVVLGVLASAAVAPTEISDENGSSVRLSPTGIDLTTPGEVRITAAQIHLSSGTGRADGAVWEFSGVVKTSTLIAESVVAASYSPGAGNIW